MAKPKKSDADKAKAAAAKKAAADAKALMSEQEKTAARAQEKIENFKKLAVKRVSKALGTMATIKNLANRNSYTFDQAQADKICQTLADAVKDIDTAFDASLKGKSAVAKSSFTLE